MHSMVNNAPNLHKYRSLFIQDNKDICHYYGQILSNPEFLLTTARSYSLRRSRGDKKEKFHGRPVVWIFNGRLNTP